MTTALRIPEPMPMDPNYVRPPRDPERPGPLQVAEVHALEGQLKVGYVQGFTVRCDEAAASVEHGTDSAPSPLGYFTAGIAFCLSTQIVSVANVLKMKPRNVRVKVTAKFFREGSVLQGNPNAVCDGIKTEVELESDEPEERVAHLIRMAEASCFAMGAIRGNPSTEFSARVNGAPLALEAGATA